MPTRPPTCCPAARCTNPRPCPDHPTRWAEGLRGRRMPPGWPATRARILDRDGHACRDCGQPAAEVHHTRPGVELDELLLSLCSACHLARTLDQAATARAASAPGERSPAAPVTGRGPDAPGDQSPAAHSSHLPRRAAPGWGVTPPGASAGGAVPVPARSAAGFGLFRSPQVTGGAVVAGQRPAPPGGPPPRVTRLAGHPLRPVTGRVRPRPVAGHPAEPVTERAGSPG